MTATTELTPMMSQYRSIKKEIPHAILLFRLGDFYEMFFDDAKIASRILGLTLTARGAKGVKVPMCGVPYHAAQGYIARLIKAGHKVAVCDQTEDPRFAKGIVKRELTRVITPGTVLDENLLPQKCNNYLVALHRAGAQIGLSFLDLSTGEFRIAELKTVDELKNEITRLDPKEILVSESVTKEEWLARHFNGTLAAAKTVYDDWVFSYDHAYELLKAHFKTQSLDGFGCQGMIPGVGAAGAILHFLKENRHDTLRHITRLGTYSTQAHLILDAATQRNLELVANSRNQSAEGTLLSILDATMTAMGGRLLRQWILHPLTSVVALQERQDGVEELLNHRREMIELREMLAEVKDIERLIGKLNCGSANGRDFVALKNSLSQIPELKKKLESFQTRMLRSLAEDLDPVEEVCGEIAKTMVDDPPLSVREGGMIRPGFNSELDQLRAIAHDGKSWIARFQQEEIERSGIRSLKVRHNKVFGYYIEVSNANLKEVPTEYIRKQTLVNGERFITPELKEYETKVFSAQEKSEAMEYDFFCQLREKVLEHTARIQKLAQAVAQLDVLGALAWVAAQRNYVRPKLSEGDRIEIVAGRHPVIETLLTADKFIPNDTTLDGGENQLLIITGPNMAGKSTYIRQVALLTLMAQMGSFIPADRAEISVVDRIFTRVGASDELSRGQSTFMVEMNEAANILNHATPRSLIILDEIGRGTSTFDGISIAWAIAEFLHNHPQAKAKTLFATHYHELTQLESLLPGVKNYNIAVKEWNQQVIFLRKIVRGGTDKSYGIHVARLAGLPPSVIERALDILKNLEKGAFREDGKPAFVNLEEAAKKSETEQLYLFEQPEHPVVQKLKDMEVDQLTPLQALQILDELKKEIE